MRDAAEPSPRADGELAVDVRDLVKEFPAPGGGVLRAVDGVSFTVSRGEVFGFLGPNGAGKTTTLEVIEGLQSPTAGTTHVFGLDSQRDRDAMKRRIGVQLQAGAYFQYLTLEEILDLFGSFYPSRVPAAPLLDKVGLLEKRKALVGELSGGQAQRFSIVASMVNDPDVLFLDEPTTGLDPQARHNLWDLIRSINDDDGKTVILTTHYMEEAELLCDRIAVIDRGTIRALDTPLSLIRTLPAAYRIVFATQSPVDPAALKALSGVVDVSAPGDGMYELRMAHPEATLRELLAWTRRRRIAFDDLRVLPATLEDVFLSLTGRALRE
jgi:ABC-2 type transport system ATP-binding protein